MSKKSLFAVVSALVVLVQVSLGADVPKNIVLMIGDGMGHAQLTATKVVKAKLNMERMPVGGMVTTFAKDDFVTDSAAAATALATGEKTNNGMLSQAPGGKPLKTLFEYAKEAGKFRGIVVTCSLTHATPAAFASHVKGREMNDEIAEHMAGAGLEVMFGGGLAYFMPRGMPGSSRQDNKNLIDVLAKRGEVVVQERQFAGLSEDKPATALIALKHPAPSKDRSLSLGAMVAKALPILATNGKGFVLMVEGSQIDWEAHKNDAAGIIRETIEFDDAVGVVLDFAQKDGRTLVVVTADHETGGMTLLGGSIKDKAVSKAEFSTHDHSAVMVPLFAFGPGSVEMGGLKDNTDIGKKLIEYAIGLK